MMSSVDFLYPTNRLQYSHANSDLLLHQIHGFSFYQKRFRVFCRHSTQRSVSNYSSSFPSTVSSVVKIHEPFNLWTGLLYNSQRLRDTKTLASSQDGDSTETSETEATTSSSGSGSTGTSTSQATTSHHKTTQSSGSGRSDQKREKRNKNGGYWWSRGKRFQWQPIIQAQEIGVLLLQLGIVMFVMRLLRPGIPLPGSEPRTPTSFVSVPYSEFLSRINSDQVQKVEVDGVHIMFKLKNDGVGGLESEVSSGGVGGSRFQESESLLKSMTPTKRIVYTTTRPSDIKTPYEKMLENQVEFGSPDKRSGGFLNSALVSVLCCAAL